MRTRTNTRRAFTLVEMMVATALILFLIIIIAQVFGSASKTYNQLRVAGDMQEKLRTSGGVLRRDLSVEHFDGPFVIGRSGPRVGDQRLDQPGWTPPTQGYLEIYQQNPSIVDVGGTRDSDGLWSTRATDHYIRFTNKLPDLQASELYCAELRLDLAQRTDLQNAFPAPAGGQSLYYSRWAEIVYFLDVTSDSITPTGQQIFSLRRRVRVLAPNTAFVGEYSQTDADNLKQQYPELALVVSASSTPGRANVHIMSPRDVTLPGNRVQPGPVSKRTASGDVLTCDDLLIPDVLSFEVRAAWFDNPSFNSLAPGSSPASRAMGPLNSDAPFDDIPVSTLRPGSGRLFDTSYQPATSYDWDRPADFLRSGNDNAPSRINVRAVQIKIRVWDSKAGQARQTTIIQEL